MQEQDSSKKIFVKKEDEKVLVVEREKLFSERIIHGIKEIDFDFYKKLIEKNKKFLWRSEVEIDPSYKQIIPYLIFKFENKLFLMRRKNNSSDVRLQNKYSLGIGGHIKQTDIANNDIFDWARREFKEEVEFSGNFKFRPIGLLNDESNFVGQVHTGFVFLLESDSDKIKIRDEHQEGYLRTLEECKKVYSSMESWSQMVFDYLYK